jgi:Protein of unknown function (DUF3168)
MSTAALALQKAIHTALSAHAPLSSQVTAIVDGPAPDQPLPYIQIGDSLETDWSTKTFDGREHRLTIHAWSSQPGSAQARQLLALADDVLTGALPALTGHKIISRQFIQSRVLTDEDGQVRHGLADYRFRTQPTG